MSKVPIRIHLNTRALIWIHFLAQKSKVSSLKYIEMVLLRHLEQTPEIDLSRSPYSEPKGVSNGKTRDRSSNV